MRCGVLFLLALTIGSSLVGCGDGPSAASPETLDAAVEVDAQVARADASLAISDARAGRYRPRPEAGATIPRPPEPPPTSLGDCDELSNQPGLQYRPLFEAAHFDVEFVAMSGGHVSVRGADGAFRVLHLPGAGPIVPSKVRSWSLPSGVTALASSSNETGLPSVVGCDRATSVCSLYVAVGRSSLLQLRSDSTLPPGFVTHGVFGSGTEWCVFGSSLLCLRGSKWETVIEQLPTGDELVDVAVAVPSTLAISNRGRVWLGVREASSFRFRFSEQAKIDATLTNVSVAGSYAFLWGRDSLWWWNDGAVSRWNVAAGIRAALVADSAGELALLTDAGDLWTYRSHGGHGWCRRSDFALPGELLEADVDPCGLANNFRFLTSQSLVGQNECFND